MESEKLKFEGERGRGSPVREDLNGRGVIASRMILRTEVRRVLKKKRFYGCRTSGERSWPAGVAADGRIEEGDPRRNVPQRIRSPGAATWRM